ncbi:insulin-like growth factor 2 mRNA-binding protein 2 isoform X1 [Mizuhopecten yessoensis]|uniref:insulin-like growth factor 2 mRNA-binding protein 2 isoform X1 n=1 Tax=Mizuhopecten yessoensis TaxID=6573 RepID=UPI000B45986F|nr:insulin-like growth factor 2 mRNA-binding protein 2 isoform X1 [Mizuhopecten yessoensis]
MFRVYVGNLNPEVDEGTLRGLFEERGVQTGNILVKRKYAFVDCPDQENVDRAIESLNGYSLMGSNMQVEPSMSRRRRSNKLQVKNLPQLSRDELESFLGSFANLEKVEQAGAEGLVYVQYSNADEAQTAYNHINGYDWSGILLKADFASNRTRKSIREPNMSNSGGGGGGGGPNSGGPGRQVEMPLRILVGSEFIGAIIGKQGQTIHNITSQTKARVDIHRRDGQAVSTETPITIKGSPESSSEACKEMMTIVQTEAQKYNKGDYPFKILCPNHLCGRIIGKQGNVIKNFMDKTNTHIVVSSAGGGQGVADANNMYVDRVVTVTGSVENASQAESLLSDKMRKCFDQDQHGYMGQISMFGGMPPMAPGMMPGFSNYQAVRPPFGHYPPPMQQEGYYPGNMAYGGGAPPMPPPELEVTYLYVPENTVGSIIGSKGANIKDISKSTGARVKIIQPSSKEPNGERNGQNIQERRCIVTGSPEAQFQAHFQIFDRIKKEGGFSRMEDVHLRSEIMVPKGMIGRIIGKGGQNVREIQRVSGAIVNLPELNNQNPSEDGEVPVSIIGHFQAMQAAQRRVRQLVSNSSIPPKRRPSQREQNGKQQM